MEWCISSLLSKQDQESLLHCLASVLHICGVCFIKDGEGSSISNLNKVEVSADLLQVDAKELVSCFTQEAMVTRGIIYIMPYQLYSSIEHAWMNACLMV